MLKPTSCLIVVMFIFGCSLTEEPELITNIPINLNDTVIVIPIHGSSEITKLQFEIKNQALKISSQYHDNIKNGITEFYDSDTIKQKICYSEGQALLITDYFRHQELTLFRELTGLLTSDGKAAIRGTIVYDQDKNIVDSLTKAFILDKSMVYDNSLMKFKVLSPYKYCDIIFGKFDLNSVVSDTLHAMYDVKCGIDTVISYDKFSSSSNIIQGIVIAHDHPRNPDGSFVPRDASIYVIYEIVGDLKKEIDKAEQQIEDLLD